MLHKNTLIGKIINFRFVAAIFFPREDVQDFFFAVIKLKLFFSSNGAWFLNFAGFFKCTIKEQLNWNIKKTP